MNVLLITKHLNIGGITNYTINLASQLKRNGIGVFVVSSGGQLLFKLKEAGIKHFYLHLDYKNEFHPKILFLKKSLVNIINQYNIDIIHAQTRATAVLSYFASRQTKIPYITTCHGFYNIRFTRRLFPFLGKAVIVVSRYVYHQLKDIVGVNQERIKLIPNGIDIDRFSFKFSDAEKKEFRRKFGITKDGPVIGYIARLSPLKGHSILLKSFRKVLEEEKDASLLIIGDEQKSIKFDLCRLAKELNIENNIIFYQGLLDTRQALAVMDVFCFPSQRESFGLAILEAMASGVCVVASKIDGIKTIITDNLNGLLVDPKDCEGFAEKILLLLKDKRLYEGLSKEALRTVRKEFNIQDMTNRIIGVYQDLM